MDELKEKEVTTKKDKTAKNPKASCCVGGSRKIFSQPKT